MDFRERNGYYVGQEVMIREWDDLIDEFGFDNNGDIPCGDLCFIEEMEQYCGRTVTISRLLTNRVVFVEPTGPWEYNYNMIQPLERETEEDLAFDEAFVIGIENLI